MPLPLSDRAARRWLALTLAVTVTLAAYLSGNALGRGVAPGEPGVLTDAVGAEPERPSADAAAAPLERPVGPAGDDPLDLTGLTEGVLVSQPITGPGQPPMSMTGGGPHGTRRTTGFGFAALTFDDGPDPRWTPQVLELLREHDVQATFCVIGQYAEAHPELIKQIAEEGHTLCNHSWDHDFSLGHRPADQIRADLERTNEAIRAGAPGVRISYYRQPGGAWTDRVVQVATELGMASLHWDVDPADWRTPGARTIAETLRNGTAEESIVLLHDGGGDRSGTVRALRRSLPDLLEQTRLHALPPGIDPPPRHGVDLPVKPSQR